MRVRRRQLFTWIPGTVAGVALAQPEPPRMRPVPAAQRAEVQVGAGTQAGATTGSSGPKKAGDQEGASAGTQSSTQPGGSGSGGGPAPSPGRGGASR